MKPADNAPGKRFAASLTYLACGIAIFVIVTAWDVVFLRLWGKN